MGREFELKFSATREQQAAIAAAFGEFTAISMETTYYDTPNRDLSSRHITLRHRLENGKSICTLKTPAAGGGRGEWETECEHIGDAIDVLCKLSGISLPEKEGLIPLCGAKFTRLAKTVMADGCVVELALDSGVLLGGGREASLCEVEVELKSGSEAAAVRFAEALALDYGLQPEKQSKFCRALTLANNTR